MNKKIIIGIVIAVLVVVGGFFIFSQLNSDSKTNDSTNTSVEQNVAKKDMSQVPADLSGVILKAMERQNESNVYIIDVRTPQEWKTGHVKGALSQDLYLIAVGDMPPVDKNAELYIYCNSGNRAAQAIVLMQQKGFTNMTNIRGYDDWVAAGGAIETGM